jgi:outer membrane murein-binding lipoprotein Lpp
VQASPQQVQSQVQALPQQVQALPQQVQALPQQVQALPQQVQALPQQVQALPEQVPSATPPQTVAPTSSSMNPAQVPSSFKCPITNDVMREPVIDPEGNSYEKYAIEDWLARGNK